MSTIEGLYPARFRRERTGDATLGILHSGKLSFSAGLPPSIEATGDPREWYLAQELNSGKIGALIRKLRTPNESRPPVMTTTALAAASGISQAAVSSIERGESRPNFPHARALLRELGRGILFLRFDQAPNPHEGDPSHSSLLLLEPGEGYAKILGEHFADQIDDQATAAADIGTTQSRVSEFCNGGAAHPRIPTIEHYFGNVGVRAGLLLVIPPTG